MLITPENIIELKDNEIFVFGSNEAGRHGKGAAKTALKFGAKYGKGFGFSGLTFAIPTKDKNLNTLSLDQIKYYVDKFYDFAKDNSNLTFLITEIGCGLAGYSPKDIAPLFEKFKNLANVALPKRFIEILYSEII